MNIHVGLPDTQQQRIVVVDFDFVISAFEVIEFPLCFQAVFHAVETACVTNRTRKAKLTLFNKINAVPHLFVFLQYALHLCIWYRVTRSYNSGSLSLSGI